MFSVKDMLSLKCPGSTEKEGHEGRSTSGVHAEPEQAPESICKEGECEACLVWMRSPREGGAERPKRRERNCGECSMPSKSRWSKGTQQSIKKEGE